MAAGGSSTQVEEATPDCRSPENDGAFREGPPGRGEDESEEGT